MNDMNGIDGDDGLSQAAADEYASWFRCLADGTRLRVLAVVAAAGRPMTVGEIVDRLDKSQSTISRHLRVLADERFVLMEPDGVRTLVRANPECMTALPIAAAAVMGRTDAAQLLCIGDERVGEPGIPAGFDGVATGSGSG